MQYAPDAESTLTIAGPASRTGHPPSRLLVSMARWQATIVLASHKRPSGTVHRDRQEVAPCTGCDAIIRCAVFSAIARPSEVAHHRVAPDRARALNHGARERPA